MLYRKWGHTKYDCRYHIIWVTKYRKEWIHEKLQEVLAEALLEICDELFIKAIRVGMEEDHIHMYVSIPLSVWSIPEVIQKLKWKSSKRLWEIKEYEEYFKKFYWKPWIWKWAAWYFICTVWEITDKIIKEYIEEQWKILIEDENKSPAL